MTSLAVLDPPLDSADHARAILNILEDFSAEKDRLADTQRAMLNILEDFSAEKDRLEATQKAMLNILDDFDAEKSKVETVNEDLLRENRERRLTEAALTERSVELARSNADLEQFAYVASHDLQEPLRMVSSYVQLLERRYKGQLDAQADKYIGYAVDGARRMQGLIGGLLEYSRAGLDNSAPTAIPADTALDQALRTLRGAFEESGAVLSREPLPRVIADGLQLAQVFQNLIANAIKFRRSDEVPRIHVQAERRERDCVLSVRDQGIGLDPQYADRIFMIFQRLHTAKEYPGTGIGLAVCKKVIERNGGRIWVESSEGEGATFHFTLPLAPGGEP
jgi:light-regulated signal transduction histidine kinase (bacteriophytochrome)